MPHQGRNGATAATSVPGRPSRPPPSAPDPFVTIRPQRPALALALAPMDDRSDDPPGWATATWPTAPAASTSTVATQAPVWPHRTPWQTDSAPPRPSRPVPWPPRRPAPIPPARHAALSRPSPRRPLPDRANLGGAKISRPAPSAIPGAPRRPRAAWAARGHAARRLLQHLVIPVAAVAVVAWGAFGVDPPAFPAWQSLGGRPTAPAVVAATPEASLALAAAVASPTRAPTPTPAPPLLTWPATPATPAGTPVATPTPTQAANPAPPRLATRAPGTLPSPSPRPSPTAPSGSPPTPPIARDCTAPPSPPPPTGPAGRATTTDVNLRAAPGLDCPVVTVLPAGSQLRAESGDVLADGRRWLRVRVPATDQTGWVAADLLRTAP